MEKHVHDGDSHDQPKSWTTAVVAGLLVGLFSCLFSCIFAVLVFDATNPYLFSWVSIGVNMHTLSALVSGLFTTLRSSVGIQAAGPDITTTLSFQSMTKIIATQIEKDGVDKSKVLPTTLFVMLLSGFLLALVYLALGKLRYAKAGGGKKLRYTRVVQFVPTSIHRGFMACIGWKTLVAALKTSVGPFYTADVKPLGCNYSIAFVDSEDGGYTSSNFWILLLPAFVVGIPLFLCKTFHILDPRLLSTILLLPLVFFYAIVQTTNDGTKWWLPVSSPATLEKQWYSSTWSTNHSEYGGCGVNIDGDSEFTFSRFRNIHWDSVLICLPEIFVVVLIQTVEFLLNLAVMKKELDSDVDFDDEMWNAGRYNLMLLPLISPAACSQLKFTLIGHGIVHDRDDRRPGFVAAVLCAMLFMFGSITGLSLLNLLPRFYLGGMLIFAGVSYLYETLFTDYSHLPVLEYANIWFILICYIVSGLLQIALLFGVVTATILFVQNYRQVGVVKSIITGSDYESYVQRSSSERKKLVHLSKSYMIIQFHHFLFTFSASQCYEEVKKIYEGSICQKHPLRYLIMDWGAVDGIEENGVEFLDDMVKYLDERDIDVVFTGTMRVAEVLAGHGIYNRLAAVLDNVDHGVEFVEESLLLWAHNVRSRWFELEALQKFHDQSKLRVMHDALEASISNVSDDIWLYLERKELNAGETLFVAGDMINTLYIVQTGCLSAYKKLDDGSQIRISTMKRGAFCNEFSLFENFPARHLVLADSPTTVLGIDRQMMLRMDEENPRMALGIMQSAMRQYCQEKNKLEQQVGGLQGYGTTLRSSMPTSTLVSDECCNGELSSCDIVMQVWLDGSSFVPSCGVRRMNLRNPRTNAVSSKAQEHGFHNFEKRLTLKKVAQLQNTIDRMHSFTSRDDRNLNHGNGPTNTIVLRMSARMENDCRACFKAHDTKKTGILGVGGAAKALRDLGVFVDDNLLRLRFAEIRRRVDRKPDYSRTAQSQMFDTREERNGHHNKKIELLSDVNLFSELSRDDSNFLSRLASIATIADFEEEEYLCVQGELAESMLVVIEGRRRTLDSVNEPIVMGEKAMFEDLPRGANVVSTQAVRALEIRRYDMEECFERTHPVWRTLELRFKRFEHRDARRKRIETVATVNNKGVFGMKFREISRTPLFRDILKNNTQDITRLANSATLQNYVVNDLIVDQKKPVTRLIIVLQGVIRIEECGICDSSVVGPILLGEGAIYNLLGKSTVGQESSTQHTVANSDVTTIHIPVAVFLSMFAPEHSIWKRLREKEKDWKSRFINVYGNNMRQSSTRSSIVEVAKKLKWEPKASLKRFTIANFSALRKPSEDVQETIAENQEIETIDASEELVKGRKLEINLLEFLDLTQGFKLKALGEEDFKILKRIFESHASDDVISRQEFIEMTNSAFNRDVNSHGIADRLLKEWGRHVKLDCSAFASMVSYFMREKQTDKEVRQVFDKLCLGSSGITLNGIIKVWHDELNSELTAEAAAEMVSEADFTDSASHLSIVFTVVCQIENEYFLYTAQGILNFRDFVATLLSVHDSELEAQSMRDALDNVIERRQKREVARGVATCHGGGDDNEQEQQTNKSQATSSKGGSWSKIPFAQHFGSSRVRSSRVVHDSSVTYNQTNNRRMSNHAKMAADIVESRLLSAKSAHCQHTLDIDGPNTNNNVLRRRNSQESSDMFSPMSLARKI